MGDLTGKLIANTYKDLLQIASSATNGGLDGTLRAIQDGSGNNSSLKISETSAAFTGNVSIAGNLNIGNSFTVGAVETGVLSATTIRGSTVSVTNITTDTLTAETLTFQDVSVSSLRTGNLTVTNNVTATAYYGNGNNLTVSGVPLETRIEAVSALTVVNQTNIVANTSLIAINQTSISANASAVVALSATLETRIASVSALTAINKTSITANASAVVALSATLETRIASVSTLTAINKSSITANASAVVALSATLETRIASVSALTAVNKTSITANVSAVAALSATLETRIAAVSVLTATNKTSITANASAVVALSATLESRIAALSATVVTSITANASAIVALSATLENRIEVLSATISELPTDSRIAAVSALTVVNQTSIAANASAVVALSATLETRIAAVSVLTATNKTSIAANASAVVALSATLETRIAAVSVLTATNKTSITANTSTIVALSATLESRIAALSATVATSISNYLPLAGGTLTGDLNFGDNDKAIFGAGSDLEIYHDGSNSIIKDGGTGDLQIKGANVEIQTAGGNRYFTGQSNVARLFHTDSERLATTSTGIDVTGVITTDGLTTTADINFGDNDKAIFGAGSDLQIYHNANNSFIQDTGTGSLFIDGSSTVTIRETTTNENMAVFTGGGSASLYHNGILKLATTSTGIDISGTATMTGLGVDTSSVGGFKVTDEATSGVRLTAYQGTTNSNVRKLYVDAQAFVVSTGPSFGTTVTEAMRINSSGNLGIGTDSPSKQFHQIRTGSASDLPTLSVETGFITQSTNVAASSQNISIMSGNTGEGRLFFGDTDDEDVGNIVYNHNSNYMTFDTAANERMRIDASGNLLVGTTANPSGTVEGIRATSNGVLYAAAAGTAPLALYRHDSDGNIAVFHKDGTNVGSIGTYAGTRLRIGSSAGAGMLFGGTQIYPATDGTLVDNTHDLGTASYRWKDLYLSGTAYINGIDSGGQVVIDVDNVADGALRIEANQTVTNNDFYFAQEIVSTLSGADTATADREQGGIYMDINSTATGGNTSNEHRVYGMYLDVDSTGDSDLVYGVYADATASPTLGTTSSVIGGLFRAEDNGGAGNVTNVIGVQGIAVSDNATSDTNLMEAGQFRVSNVADSGAIGAAVAVTGEIDVVANSGDIYGTSKCFSAVYDNNSEVAQTNTTYLFWGDYQGVLPTTAYGVYIVDDVPNYFNGNVGIGDATPDAALHINKAADQKIILSGSANPYIHFQEGTVDKAYIQWNDNGFLQFINQETGQYRFMSTAANQSADLILIRNDTGVVTNDYLGSLSFGHTDGAPDFPVQTKHQLPARIVAIAAETQGSADDGADLAFFTKPINAAKSTDSIERMRIDSEGNVGLNKTNPTYAIDQYDSNTVADLHFRFANGSGGGLQCSSYYSSSILTLASTTGRGLHFSSAGVRPARADTGPNYYNDNAMDLGFVSSRWDDVYATNGTIQTSDRNEKQDIEELSDAEQRVAVAAKGLLQKFRWKDAVNKKGDEARTHFGIIAQDLEDAFTAEGLDAGKYAMFIKSSWWEHEVQIEATEDKEAYTEIHEYETEEEAPDGAVEKIRLGVRYSELLAFIIAAI